MLLGFAQSARVFKLVMLKPGWPYRPTGSKTDKCSQGRGPEYQINFHDLSQSGPFRGQAEVTTVS
ncbi:hypothetical protein AA0229_0995 [Gluconobacter cerinus NRIC 0229]|nr:hypothetical protein AA0229_0995 [Gluconobacter cerinus NRIC 0229]